MKPAGIFNQDGGIPSWATFALLGDWANFTEAATLARETGVRWVLGLYGYPLDVALADVLPRLVERIDEAGLRQYLVGVCYSEEWYGLFKAGTLTNYAALTGLHETSAGIWHGVQLIHWWTGQQHASIRRALPDVPVVWIDGFVNDDLSFGPRYWQPVPHGVDVLALEAYVSARGSWASDVEPFLDHAVATRTEPIALVVQGFRAPGDGLWDVGPADAHLPHLTRWLAHPRVIASWIFDWHSRPTIQGLDVLDIQPRLLAALGVQ